MTTARTLPAVFLKTIRVFVVLFALLMLLAIVPTPARAATQLTDAQISAVVGLLKAFDVDTETIGSVEAILNGSGEGNTEDTATHNTQKPAALSGVVKNGFPAASVCGVLLRDLGKGSEGEDVAQLQTYLKETGDFDHPTATGYFGEKTEMALRQLQARAGIVSSGEASTTGFGALGPRTRELLMNKCHSLVELKRTTGSVTPSTAVTKETPPPVCVLRASEDVIESGESVTLKWESKYATSASSASGERGAVSGSVVVTPEQTSGYIKRVYGPGGEGECTTVVEVRESAPAAEPQMVVVPTKANLASVISSIGEGVDVLIDAYVGLFDGVATVFLSTE